MTFTPSHLGLSVSECVCVTIVSTQFPVSNFSVVLSIFEAEQLQIGNLVETRQNCVFVASSVHTADTDKTRQFCLVRVGGVNKLLE